MDIDSSSKFLFIYALVTGVAFTVYAAFWAARDARKRDKSPLLVFLLVFFLQFPLGLIAWLVFRPAIPVVGKPPITTGDADADIKRRANEGLL